MSPGPHLRRGRDPQGREHWIWREAGLDFAVPLQDEELAEAAQWLLSWRPNATVVGRPVDAAGWTLCRPGRPGKGLAIGQHLAAHARDFGRQLRNRFPQSPEALAFERGRFDD